MRWEFENQDIYTHNDKSISLILRIFQKIKIVVFLYAINVSQCGGMIYCGNLLRQVLTNLNAICICTV